MAEAGNMTCVDSMHMIRTIREDIKACIAVFDDRMRTFREDVMSRVGALETSVTGLDGRLATIDQKLTALNAQYTTASNRLNTINQSLTLKTNDEAPIPLNQCLNNVMQNLTTHTTRFDATEKQLNNINQSINTRFNAADKRLRDISGDLTITADDGAPSSLNLRLKTISRSLALTSDRGAPVSLDQHLNTMSRSLNTIGQSLTLPNNGGPIKLNDHLNAIHQRLALTTNTGASISLDQRLKDISGSLDVIGQSLTLPDNGGPIELNKHLIAIRQCLSLTTNAGARISLDQCLQDIIRSLDTISQSLRLPDNRGPINLNELLTAISQSLIFTDNGELITLGDRLDSISQSLTLTNNGEPATLDERLDSISQSLIITNGKEPTTLDERLNTISQSLILTRNGDPTTLGERLQELQTELRAGHFNSAARTTNATIRCCDTAISAFHGIDNERIQNFPVTFINLRRLREEMLDEILGRLGLSAGGTVSKKQRRLAAFLGLRFGS